MHIKNQPVELKGKNKTLIFRIQKKNYFYCRTLAHAFTTLSTQTSKESDAHTVIANTLLNDISIPMKNLAEAQLKERRSVNDKKRIFYLI